nr:zinc finger, CCHC-type [Tanacetum cinerariifolium]
MKGYIDNLERLGQPVGQNLAVSLILVSLNKNFDSFVQNYNMHGMGKTVNELHAMLKLHEETLPKKDANPALHAIRAGRVQRNHKNKSHKAGKGSHGKGKGKMGNASNNASFASKPKTPPPPKKDNPAKDAICHQCGEVGHWRRNCLVYLAELIEKEEVISKQVENQLGKTIKSLRSDRGGEYMSQEFLDHLKEHGIIAHRTPPYTPQNNGVSERRNRTLLDMVRSMMSQNYSTKVLWHGQAPKLSYLKVWGCEAFVKRDTLTKLDKLDPRSFKRAWDYCPSHSSLHATKQWSVREEESNTARHGYPNETMGYSLYSPSENKVFVTRNAEFFESKLLDQKASGSVEDLELIQEEDTNPSVDTSLNHEEDDQEINEPQSDINPIRKSSRTPRAPDRIIIPPKAMSEARMREIIRDQVTTSMAKFFANMNHGISGARADGTGTGSARAGGAGAGGAGAGGAGAGGAGADGAGVGGAGPTSPKITGCTYITFMKCEPHSFKGTKGRALTWWNGRIASMGIDAANGTPWTEGLILMGIQTDSMNWPCCPRMVEPGQVKVEQYIRGFSKNIRGDVTSSRTAGIDEAVRMAYQLMGQIIQLMGKIIQDKTDEASEGDCGGRGDNRRDYNRQKNQRRVNVGAMTNAALNDNEVCPKCKNKKHSGDC